MSKRTAVAIYEPRRHRYVWENTNGFSAQALRTLYSELVEEDEVRA